MDPIILNDLEIEIVELEKSLLTEEVRKNKERLNELISDSYIELGPTGVVATKDDIMFELEKEVYVPMESFDFMAREISKDIFLLVYKLQRGRVMAFRSSIWTYNNKKLQIIFHQTTKL